MTTYQKYVQFLRTQFPPGSRVLLTSKGNPESEVNNGVQGTLAKVDSAGRFLVDWDTGQHTALNPEYDIFQLRQPASIEMKLYFPVTADRYCRNEWGDLEEEPEELTGRELTPYAGNIQTALAAEQLPEEQERGLMRWYDKNDTLSWKVRSAKFDVEEKDGVLWGIADCRIDSPLEGEELQQLVSYLSGQASDGWGEGFEQRPIFLNEEELYVHLWQERDWEISQEAMLSQQDTSTSMGMAP